MTYWACSDMHGYYSFYKGIKDIIGPEDIVICLGDCGDRGPRSWNLIKAVLNDPQFIYLKGNHEDMLAKAIRAYVLDDRDFNYDFDVRLCWDNGGRPTFSMRLMRAIRRAPQKFSTIFPSNITTQTLTEREFASVMQVLPLAW